MRIGWVILLVILFPSSLNAEEALSGFAKLGKIAQEIEGKQMESTVVSSANPRNTQSWQTGRLIPHNSPNLIKAPILIWDLVVPAYSADYMEYAGLSDEWVDEMPANILAMSYSQYSVGVGVKCTLSMAFNKNIGLSLKKKNWIHTPREYTFMPLSISTNQKGAKEVYEDNGISDDLKKDFVGFIVNNQGRRHNLILLEGSETYRKKAITKLTVSMPCEINKGREEVSYSLWLKKADAPDFQATQFSPTYYHIIPMKNKFFQTMLRYMNLAHTPRFYKEQLKQAAQ